MTNKTPNPRLKDSEWFWGFRPYSLYTVRATRNDGLEINVTICLERNKNLVTGSVQFFGNSGVHQAVFDHESSSYSTSFYKVRQDIRRWLSSYGLHPICKPEGAL